MFLALAAGVGGTKLAGQNDAVRGSVDEMAVPAIEPLCIRCLTTDTLMTSAGDRAALAARMFTTATLAGGTHA